MRSLSLLICFSFLAIQLAQGQINSKFKRLLKKNNLELTVPAGFVEITSIPNDEMEYQFALKHGLDTFEVRYSIFPLDAKMKEYKRNLKNPSVKLVHPNYFWEIQYNTNIRSISKLEQSEVPTPRVIAEDAVKEEFNADAGAVSFFPIQSASFSPEFKYCLMMVLHKNFEADVYISFLGNDRDTIENLALELFHALRFKN